ncbi:MAG: molybdate ABC transporter substrate-binding protein [Proteobacteria bacterium]|nr:molybdate ABC transporter substrate-binding protein [Desulfobulbaceae bacterium]MBU4151618.1 molybdate ABC transporter substrate-binding protein [Pseudomonadota bacterium]
MEKWQKIQTVLWAIGCGVVLLARTVACDSSTPLIVSAAASLTNVMRSLGQDFEQRHPGVTIIFNFGSTGDLVAQMSQGAPVDIFASASVKHMDQAQEKGLIVVQTRKVFAKNVLVLAKPTLGTRALTGISDLTSPQVERIGIGKPETVPAGHYAQETLVAAGIWSAVEGKLIFGSSVRQVLDYLRRGEVDAALIYATDAKVAKEQVKVVVELPGSRILYPVALAKTAQDSQKATLFLDYLATDEAKAILIAHGFLLPESER